MPDHIRVFVGTENKTKIAFKVLRYTIIQNSSVPVSVTPMGDFDPWLVPDDVHQATGFSLRRWMIPEYCNFKGTAIYLDADQIVFGDIAQLHSYCELSRAIVCCFMKDKSSRMLTGKADSVVPQTSVMVLNCDLCKPEEWNREAIFDRIRKAGMKHTKPAVKEYQKIMHGGLVEDVPYPLVLNWNRFNTFCQNTSLLHYTFESQQPWYEPWHPLSALWEAELIKAIVNGYVTKSMLQESLDLGAKGSGDWRKHGGLNEHYEKYLELAK